MPTSPINYSQVNINILNTAVKTKDVSTYLAALGNLIATPGFVKPDIGELGYALQIELGLMPLHITRNCAHEFVKLMFSSGVDSADRLTSMLHALVRNDRTISIASCVEYLAEYEFFIWVPVANARWSDLAMHEIPDDCFYYYNVMVMPSYRNDNNICLGWQPASLMATIDTMAHWLKLAPVRAITRRLQYTTSKANRLIRPYRKSMKGSGV